MRYGAVAALAAQFPPLETAHPDGFLCLGGDLRPERLLAAYSRGIFPWYEEGLPVLWWSPDPRCVLPLEAFHLPRRSARTLRRRPFALTLDRAFGRVIRSCAAPRAAAPGTWIIPEMIAAYERLHALGYAHSVEAWRDGALAGGLYGVALGRAFFGESMFHTEAEASRAAAPYYGHGRRAAAAPQVCGPAAGSSGRAPRGGPSVFGPVRSSARHRRNALGALAYVLCL